MNQRLDFDAQLPALRQAFDHELVIQQFTADWPSAAPALKTIHSCRLQDTKYQPASRCVATYHLVLDTAAGVNQPTIGVIEVTPAGLHSRLYTADPKLPWLIPATDPASMRDRFATLLSAEDATQMPLDCTITPIRYRAGARCVFRYDLRSATGTRTFFGKLIAQDADQLMHTVTALHQASLAHADMPQILPPLAYWPDLRMLVQPEVTGRAELNDLAFDPDTATAARERWLRDAGARLAGLHNVAEVAGPRRTLADDLDELEQYIAPMQIVDTQLAARYTSAVSAIRQLGEQPELAPVASHGAFRTDQFMIEDDRLVMIDLDGFCWSSPARDLGNYLAYLRWKIIRQPQRAALIEAAGQLLQQGYQSQRPAPEPRWLAIYAAASMLKIVGRRFRSLTVKEWHLVPALLDAAILSIEGR